MELYFLRHAEAVPRGTPGYRLDRDRPLTREGIRTQRRVARGIRRLKLELDLILSSPYERARHTAQIAADELGVELKLTPHLAGNGDPRLLIAELKGESVMLVGHEPYMSELIAVLTGGTVVLKKSGFCKLTADSFRYGRCATLDWLLAPRQLVLLGKA